MRLVALALSLAAAIPLSTTPRPASPNAPSMARLDTAVFAGGCFWSMERPFQHVPGVTATAVGFAGGHVDHPSYEEVSGQRTGHAESVQVVYDPARVTYEKLVDVYFHNTDPITHDRQFCDAGPEYRPAIFTNGPDQARIATAAKAAIDRSGHFTKPIVTEVTPLTTFWRAEEYHQHFADRNPDHYGAYRRGCGRDRRLHELWGDAAEPFVPKD